VERNQELQAQLDDASAQVAVAEDANRSATGKFDQAQLLLEGAQAEAEAAKARAEANAARLEAADERKALAQAEAEEYKGRLDALESKLASQTAVLEEQRKALVEMKPFLEGWQKLEDENNRLARLVGEARSRGRVNIQEIMARAALLKRLEKLTALTEE
jgi:uncharacterized coiled-coil protein SlyX